MPSVVVWDMWLKPSAEAEGLRLTRQVFGRICRSIRGLPSSHELLVS